LISMTVSPFRSTSRPTLYRTTGRRVIYAVIALAIFLQTALPPTVPAQITRPPKTSKGPRALGLLELAPNGKARLIPITILIDGKYYDASAYKAAPVPMALWSDTVYEAVLTGVSMGLFTVTGALQRKEANEGTEWMAEGTWQTASSIKAKAAKKPIPSVPRGINEDEGPPVLRRAGSEKPKPPEPPATPTASPQPQPAPAASSAPTQTATPRAAPATTASASAPPPPQDQAQEDNPPEDKDRPALKRGKAGAESATEAQKKAMAATSAKPGAHATTPAPSSAATTSGASSPTQPPAEAANQIQLIPAISDSNGPDPLPYTYNLKPDEEQQFRKKILAIAADEVRARARQLGSPSAAATQPAHATSAHGKAPAAKPVQPIFEDVQLRVFDLANINEPELILTAKARMPQRPRETENADLQYLVTLVVREDVNGELHKSLANITDTQHLDVIPQLELIDAVDVDGDGRAELLFRQVSDTGSAFVVYRVIGDRLYPLFQGALGQ
jgi:hypothetical protein